MRTLTVQYALAAAAVAGVVVFTNPATATTATFNFDSDIVGTATPFTDSSNGISATFSSPADPGGFAVGPTFFLTLTGNVLLDPGPAGAASIPLDIGFSQPISSIRFLFALNDLSNTTSMSLLTSAGGSDRNDPGGLCFP